MNRFPEGERIGVFAEPELVSKKLREQDQFICLASDGVWEFLSSQRVVDMVLRFTSPLEACHAVVAESYRLWLQYDVRTDDITMILAWLDHEYKGAAPRAPSEEEADGRPEDGLHQGAREHPRRRPLGAPSC